MENVNLSKSSLAELELLYKGKNVEIKIREGIHKGQITGFCTSEIGVCPIRPTGFILGACTKVLFSEIETIKIL